MEQMLGSYGPDPNGKAYIKNFDPEESPSGMIARSGTYTVKSRVVDDDGEIYAGQYIVHRDSSASRFFNHCVLQIGAGVSSLQRNGNKGRHPEFVSELSLDFRLSSSSLRSYPYIQGFSTYHDPHCRLSLCNRVYIPFSYFEFQFGSHDAYGLSKVLSCDSGPERIQSIIVFRFLLSNVPCPPFSNLTVHLTGDPTMALPSPTNQGLNSAHATRVRAPKLDLDQLRAIASGRREELD